MPSATSTAATEFARPTESGISSPGNSTEFFSGKDEEYAWDKPKKSAALTDEQQAVLKARGNLTPEQIHKLAHKGKKADCHSDNIKDEKTAKVVQPAQAAAATSTPQKIVNFYVIENYDTTWLRRRLHEYQPLLPNTVSVKYY